MNQSEVVEQIRKHLELQFPKTCRSCGRLFSSLREYLEQTEHVGAPVSLDAELGDWRPKMPIGTMSYANCKCGSTLALGSEGMPLFTIWRLMAWARAERRRRRVSTEVLLDEVRRQIDERALALPADHRAEVPAADRFRYWRESVIAFYGKGLAALTPIMLLVWIAARPAPKLAPPFGVVAASVAVLAIFQLLVPRKLRARGTLAVMLLICIGTPLQLGLSPGPLLVMLTTAIMATALSNLFAGLVVVGTCSLVMGVSGWLISSHRVPAPDPTFLAATEINNWVRLTCVFVIAAALSVVTIGALIERLERAWLTQDAALRRERQVRDELVRSERDRKRTEDAARSAQRLEAVGRLAGGVAHDFNNLLLVILSWADLMKADPSIGSSEGLAEIRRAATQASQLTRRLLAFAKKDAYRPMPIDVDAAIASFRTSLQRLLPADVCVVHERASVPAAFIDEAALGQILLNLAVNAWDAMPRGGKLVFSAALVEPPEVPGDAPDPRVAWVVIRVADTGVGMDEATKARVFEPFFTTKDSGRGTGLGLASVYGIVQQARGWIRVASEPGQGTTFTVALPLASSAATAPGTSDRATSAASARVLLVDDEEQVRRVMGIALRDAGLEVIEADSAEQGLATLRRHAEDIALLCTDGIMPGEPTSTLIDGFRELFPGAPVLVCSGYVAEELTQRGIATGVVSFLQKPFTGDELVRRVEALLKDRPIAVD